MKPLSAADQAFLWLESRQQPMHVGGLQLFNLPEDAGPNYIPQLMESLYAESHPNPPFNQHLVNKRGRYYWEEDKLFDIEHHVRHEALPKPGRIRELLAHLSAEHSHLMDRSRPLWEFHVIEGLKRRQLAVYSKIHHSMIDGVSAMRLMNRALSTDPNERNLPPIWKLPKPKKKRGLLKSDSVIGGMQELSETLRSQVFALPSALYEAGKSYRGISDDPDLVTVNQAPHCLLNQEITGSRRFAAQSYPMERFKRLSNKFNVTMNDILLAVCGSALRNYLISQHALPDQPLISMVPMSIRDADDDTELGNQVASILANLGTHVADPVDRLEIVHRSIVAAKNLYADMSQTEIINYTAFIMAPSGLNMFTGKALSYPTFNVTISNVPGPKETLYWNGAELDGIYPLSIPLNQNALNITLLSYRDQLEFGFTACRKTLPSMQRLLDYVENGLAELEVAADIPVAKTHGKARKARVEKI